MLERFPDHGEFLVGEDPSPESKRVERPGHVPGGIAGGLDDPLDVGSSFDLELTLSFVPPRTVRSLAKVVACSALAEGGYAVELSFDTISEQARDELHRYMLTTERLRRRRPTLG